ncbi:GntR family transcriptional regulator [Spirochaetia bacterium]|nr:GntR family transcriptional regulator [Spirochaetia bacterium]
MYSFNAETPIYLQLMDAIKGEIAAGKLLPGGKIASIREMAAFYAVNPNTVQRALLELEREGLLSTKRASGKTVTEDTEMIKNLREKRAKERLEGCISAMEGLGYSPRETALWFERALNERRPGQKEAAQ